MLQSIRQFKEVTREVSSCYKQAVFQDMSVYFEEKLKLPTKFMTHLKNKDWHRMVGSKGGLTSQIKGQGMVGEEVIKVMQNVYDIGWSYLGNRWLYGKYDHELTVEEQQKILVYSCIAKFLKSKEHFLDSRRSSVSYALKSKVVEDAFYGTYNYIQKNKDVDDEDISKYYASCVMQYIEEKVNIIIDDFNQGL